MKRIISIVLIIAMVMMVGVCNADTMSRREYAEQVMENSAVLMKVFRDFYKSNPSSFSDAHLIAMYDYYKMYVAAFSLKTAEFVISNEALGKSLIRNDMLKLSSDVAMMIETNWNKWLNGEYEREKVIDMLIRFIDGALESKECASD